MVEARGTEKVGVLQEEKDMVRALMEERVKAKQAQKEAASIVEVHITEEAQNARVRAKGEAVSQDRLDGRREAKDNMEKPGKDSGAWRRASGINGETVNGNKGSPSGGR